VSAAPLVRLDFEQRTPQLDPGQTQAIHVTGDFADQQDVALPSSYLTFQMTNSSVASVASNGQLHGLSTGTTVLLVSSHGIQAATAVTVGKLTDRTQQLQVQIGLDYYPQAVSLAANVGTRQLEIGLGGQVDLTAASTGTRYFASDSRVIQVSADGLVSAHAA